MKRSVSVFVLLALLTAAAPRADADQDAIGPVTIAFGQPLDLFFPNMVHPLPSVKVLQFTGDAINNGPNVADLAIHFDYIDPLGNLMVRAVPDDAWGLVLDASLPASDGGRLAPRAAVALDLMASADPRHWIAAQHLGAVDG